MLNDLAGRVADALRLVIDPELGYNIVDLGLVYKAEVKEGGVVDILMTTTTRGAVMLKRIERNAKARSEGGSEGGRSVKLKRAIGASGYHQEAQFMQPSGGVKYPG